MRGMATLTADATTITLSPSALRLVQELVGTGKYADASEVVEHGLLALEEQHRDYDGWVAEVREKVRRGTEEAERGEFADEDEMWAEFDAVIEETRQEEEAAALRSQTAAVA